MVKLPPRLLYLSDVPLEASYHGSALLYRLLQEYPPERLWVIEGNIYKSQPARRLPNVTYNTLRPHNTRLQNTRLHRWHALWLSLVSRHWANMVSDLVGCFEFDAVLTVAHGHLWVTAAAFAKKHQLPLHIIVHDDWPRIISLPPPFTNRVEYQFASVYRGAVSRLCVSPFMAEEFRRRYGVTSEVLYPSRAINTRVFEAPPSRINRPDKKVVFAFAGTINTLGYCRLLKTLAECLIPHAGSLLIFSPMTSDQASKVGLNMPNIEHCGLLRSGDLMERLRADVDVLFVPMSFADCDRKNAEISFPSKLADYTAVGLPLLIYGPAYCSVVRWARENRGVAELVDSDDAAQLALAVERLVSNPAHRVNLAVKALSVGNRFFGYRAAKNIFYTALEPTRHRTPAFTT